MMKMKQQSTDLFLYFQDFVFLIRVTTINDFQEIEGKGKGRNGFGNEIDSGICDSIVPGWAASKWIRCYFSFYYQTIDKKTNPEQIFRKHSTLKSWTRKADWNLSLAVYKVIKSHFIDLFCIHSRPQKNHHSEYSDVALPFMIMEDLFESLSTQDIEKIFSVFEDSISKFESVKSTKKYICAKLKKKTSLTFNQIAHQDKKQRSTNMLLKLCNALLRRLSNFNNSDFCGRILIFTARILSLMHPSGLNQKGDIATNNTDIDEEELAKTNLVLQMEGLFKWNRFLIVLTDWIRCLILDFSIELIWFFELFVFQYWLFWLLWLFLIVLIVLIVLPEWIHYLILGSFLIFIN